MSETSHSWYYRENDTLVLRVREQPRARHEAFGEVLDNAIKIHTTSPPVDGAANAKLIVFLGRQFGTAKRDIELRHGEKGAHQDLSHRVAWQVTAGGRPAFPVDRQLSCIAASRVTV